jgi:murein DD-endopeptidase MepM/ murein hydrolase activator NlpD
LLAALVAPAIAWASPPEGFRGTSVSRTLQRHLALVRAASDIRGAMGKLRREQASLVYARKLLMHRGNESLRRLDAYRVSKATREKQIRKRTAVLYKLARGGMMRLVFEDMSGGDVSASRLERGRAVRWLVRHDLRELSVHRRAESRAEGELVAASRELGTISALRMVQGLQTRALTRMEDQITPELRTSKRDAARTVRRHGVDAGFERDLQRTVDKEWKRLSRARGLDLLEPGRLRRPVRGPTVGRFGEYRDKVLRVPMHRNGMELRARVREHVVAAADGEVAFVGTLPGFDRVVVVDHGGGYLSLTGRLLNTKVEVGESVKANQRIGIAGPKSHDDGLGVTVYFELRHGERPIDPRRYLARSR